MTHRTIDPAKLEGREPYFLITAIVVPRPIAWVSTVGDGGVLNLAPHSYFNVISSNPWIVHFTSTGVKDTLRNVRASGEFVVNIVSRRIAERMNFTAADLPPEESEFEWAGLTPVPSQSVRPPRVGEAAISLECKVNDIVSKGNGHMVFGDVLLAHVDEGVWRDGRIDPKLLEPIGRLGGSLYTDASEGIFSLRRPAWADIKDGKVPRPEA